MYIDWMFCPLYPDEFVLEIQEGETLTRHILHYQAEGYDLETDRLVISRTNEYGTPEERMKAFSLLEEVATTEVNGAVWAIGTKSGESGYSIVTYACAAGGYVYTFSFSTDYPAGFDPAEFARVFAEEVAGCDGL